MFKISRITFLSMNLNEIKILKLQDREFEKSGHPSILLGPVGNCSYGTDTWGVMNSTSEFKEYVRPKR